MAGDSAVGDVITAVSVLWFPAVGMVSAIVGVSAVAVVSTVVFTSSGVQVLAAFPVVPVLSCASSLGRYVFGSEISYNKAPPRLPGLAY